MFSLLTNLAGNGVDYGTPNPSTFTFTAAQPIQCTNIPITDDALIEGAVDETFNITLTQTLPTDPGVQLAPTTAIVSIQDSDGKTLNSAKTIGKICAMFSALCIGYIRVVCWGFRSSIATFPLSVGEASLQLWAMARNFCSYLLCHHISKAAAPYLVQNLL